MLLQSVDAQLEQLRAEIQRFIQRNAELQKIVEKLQAQLSPPVVKEPNKDST